MTWKRLKWVQTLGGGCENGFFSKLRNSEKIFWDLYVRELSCNLRANFEGKSECSETSNHPF